MSKIGKFKFICVECKAETWVTRQERDRVALPTCSACGCRYLDAATGYARGRIKDGADAARVNRAEIEGKGGLPR